ncbi:hypothetical protein ACRALDRAFT_2016818 [Sodiomyces alcalophilus JCM 7366]|uniref:uncharacterized protein n=1 Tax=Sodiomyces alcalophilus JCM 7366 TaxID=591952 RepID=UPI0039B5B311
MKIIETGIRQHQAEVQSRWKQGFAGQTDEEVEYLSQRTPAMISGLPFNVLGTLYNNVPPRNSMVRYYEVRNYPVSQSPRSHGYGGGANNTPPSPSFQFHLQLYIETSNPISGRAHALLHGLTTSILTSDENLPSTPCSVGESNTIRVLQRAPKYHPLRVSSRVISTIPSPTTTRQQHSIAIFKEREKGRRERKSPRSFPFIQTVDLSLIRYRPGNEPLHTRLGIPSTSPLAASTTSGSCTQEENASKSPLSSHRGHQSRFLPVFYILIKSGHLELYIYVFFVLRCSQNPVPFSSLPCYPPLYSRTTRLQNG